MDIQVSVEPAGGCVAAWSCGQTPTVVPAVDAQPPSVTSTQPVLPPPPTEAHKLAALVLTSPTRAHALSFLYAASADGTRSYRITLAAGDRLCDGSTPPADLLLPRSIEAGGELTLSWTARGYRARRDVTDIDDRCYERVDIPAGDYLLGMPREDTSVVRVSHPLNDVAQVGIVLGSPADSDLAAWRRAKCRIPAAERVLALMQAELTLIGLDGAAFEGCRVTPASCVDTPERRSPTDRCHVELTENSITVTPRIRTNTTPSAASCTVRTLGTQVEMCSVSATSAVRTPVDGGEVSFIGVDNHKWYSAADGNAVPFTSMRVEVNHQGAKPLRIRSATLDLEELPDWDWFAGRGTHTPLHVVNIEPRILPVGASTLVVSFTPAVIVPQVRFRAPLRVALQLDIEGTPAVLVHSAYQSTFVDAAGYTGPGLTPFPALDENNQPTDENTPLLPLQP